MKYLAMFFPVYMQSIVIRNGETFQNYTTICGTSSHHSFRIFSNHLLKPFKPLQQSEVKGTVDGSNPAPPEIDKAQ